MTSTDQLLEEAHTAKLNTLPDGQELIDYLLDAQPFVRAGDWEGYKAKFGPPQPRGKPQHADLSKCTQTGCKGTVRETPLSATGICEACGTVVYEGIGTRIEDHFDWDYKQRCGYKVHLYSRFVNFKDLLRRIQGLNQCQMLPADRDKLAVAVPQVAGTMPVTPVIICAALKHIGLLDKHRRHKERLAIDFGWKPLITLTHDEYHSLCRLYIQVDRAWTATKHRRTADTRKVFLNYPFVYDQLCVLINAPHLRVVPQLKSKKLLDKQHAYWKKVLKFLKWQ